MKSINISIFFYLLFILISTRSYSQNIIIDGSFESNNKNAKTWNTILGDCHFNKKRTTKRKNKIKPLKKRNYGTYQSNNKPRKDNSINRSGHINYRTLNHKGLTPQKNLIEGRLDKSLKAGQTYKISFRYMSLGEFITRKFFPKELMVVYLPNKSFLNDKIKLQLEKHPPKPNIYVDLKCKNDGWGKHSLIYKANGFENFIIIGNNKLLKQYYSIYLDDLKMVEYFEPNKKETGKLLTYYSLFNTDSFILDKSSKEKLDTLFVKESLSKHTKLKISGHTDNIGNIDHNNSLSKKRANAISKYLISIGITNQNIESKGYGSKFPISNNTTELGRSKNRRVEIRIINN